MIEEIEYRDALAGGSLVLLTRTDLSEVARFSLPYAKKFKEAMPAHPELAGRSTARAGIDGWWQPIAGTCDRH